MADTTIIAEQADTLSAGNYILIAPAAAGTFKKAPLSALQTFIGSGAPGLQGPAGPQGVKGDKGDTGTQGLKGDKGDTGNTGAQGLKGDSGNTGAAGPTGPQGPAGATGAQGAQGLQGPAGTNPTGAITNTADTYTSTPAVNSIVTLSLSEYNAITTPNVNTLYIVV